eukprot:317175-Chlamydomonas_euryale.AAC.3
MAPAHILSGQRLRLHKAGETAGWTKAMLSPKPATPVHAAHSCLLWWLTRHFDWQKIRLAMYSLRLARYVWPCTHWPPRMDEMCTTSSPVMA